jgi:hypothetical protein
MKFSKEFLQEGVYDDEATISDRITGNGRWSIHHERVFKHEGKFYLTKYSVGATESQYESPYQYDGAEIECAEVFPREKTITVYEP